LLFFDAIKENSLKKLKTTGLDSQKQQANLDVPQKY